MESLQDWKHYTNSISFHFFSIFSFDFVCMCALSRVCGVCLCVNFKHTPTHPPHTHTHISPFVLCPELPGRFCTFHVLLVIIINLYYKISKNTTALNLPSFKVWLPYLFKRSHLTLVLPSLFFCNMVYQGVGWLPPPPLWTWNWRAQSMFVWYHGIG